MVVKYTPLQPHCFAYGGFDIQMLQTSDAIQESGVNIAKLDPWSRDHSFDILHCWGLGFSHYENYFWAKKSGKKLVATILMHDIDSALANLKFKVSALISKQRIMKGMLQMPDEIVVVNEGQADICNHYYKVNAAKIHVIPNVVNEIFFDAHPQNLMDYVLTTGNVCRRKNQLTLARACVQLGIRLVIIGKVMQGEEDYGKRLKRFTAQHPDLLTWVAELKENSLELINYYKSCRVFALPSFVEQQPISALEAAVLQKPLVLAKRPYANQKFYRPACLVDPGSITAVAEGLLKAWQHGRRYIPHDGPLQECRKQNIGANYKKLYENLFI